MGLLINTLRKYAELFAKNNSLALKISGFLITFIMILISGTFGWIIERLSFSDSLFLKLIGSITLSLALASSIAYRSLFESVVAILKSLPEKSSPNKLDSARQKLQEIVGRDTNDLDRKNILRATAESTSENSVDGIFAPIFWILIGLLSWDVSLNLPGPLAFAWIFKASSTLDSMLGYKEGNLIWLGYSSAKLDDLLTWIPCRLVLMSLPLVTRKWTLTPQLIKGAWIEGSKYESPNSGLSEAIFAHCLQIKMGGENKYNKELIKKEILAGRAPEATKYSIKKMLRAILYLELLWVAFFSLLTHLLFLSVHNQVLPEG